jgi:hypothetical protein
MKTKFQQHLLASALVGALASVSTAARADDTVATPAPAPTAAPTASPAMDSAAATDKEPWQFGVTVPLWAPQINGNATIHGVQRDVDISYETLRDHLDTALALAVQAQKGKFGIFGDVGYMRFSGDVTDSRGAKADFGLKFVLADAGVSYQLLKTESEDHPFLLAGTLGLRYWYTGTTLEIKDSHGTKLLNGSNYQNLEDPMFGLRGSQFFTKKFHLDFGGDVGGFGMAGNNMAELDWSATGLLTYDFCKWFSVSGGYKAIGLDASKGSGKHKDGVNVIFHGALVAATLTF